MKRPTTPPLTLEIQNAVLHARLAELERLLSGLALTAEQRVWLALTTRDEATQRWLLADCRESASFHRGALAVVRDDDAAIREAHARGVNSDAPITEDGMEGGGGPPADRRDAAVPRRGAALA